MKIEQIYTKCLAQGSYYIESEGEAVIIDPLREIDSYLEKTEQNNTKVKYIFETHFHADFVSGHVSLSKKTGAPIIFGPNATTSFDAIIAKDNQTFSFGNLKIKALHTPGHTLESTTYLLMDKEGKTKAAFTGDTLFLGDVGRPDLVQGKGLGKEELAGMLYDSIREKIMPLEEDVLIYPAHGAGSACGKNMMSITSDTLGNQKKVNYALKEEMTREEFIEETTKDLLESPDYFKWNVQLNTQGYNDTDSLLHKNTVFLSLDEFENKRKEEGVIVLDVRHQKDFTQGFIPNAIFVGLDGMFAPWAATILKDINQPLLVVAPEGREEETITRLARVGFDNVLGFLKGGFQTWKDSSNDIDSIKNVEAIDLKEKITNDKIELFDVRKPMEYKNGYLANAKNIPLDSIHTSIEAFKAEKGFYIYCGGGYRSVIAASILKRNNINDITNIVLGFQAIRKDLAEFIKN